VRAGDVLDRPDQLLPAAIRRKRSTAHFHLGSIRHAKWKRLQ